MATYETLLRTLSGTLDRQRESIDDLTRVNRTRDLFLATVSHEMRTPLSALSMRIELMLRTIPDLPAKAVSGLESMRVHVRQEAGMVDDLIDAARTLTGQMSRLQQVCWNLLFNAVKFTPAGGVIRIRIRRLADWVEIDIADSGQGIEAEDLPHVFGAFKLQQHDNATGLGLGLYIARRIVELHEGTLSVSSAGRGQGATFAIRLPVVD